MEENEKQETNVIEELQDEISNLKDQLLRAVAETQNIQKRSEKEKADISKYSISGFAKDVLSIRDNLQLALNSCVNDTNSIVEGIKLTMSEMDKILDRYGIKIIETLHKPFNPHYHQANLQAYC